MWIKNKIKMLSVVATGLIAMSSWAAPRQSILSIRDNISDETIVYPESFETNTTEMMKNWYLQNYTVLDKDVERKAPDIAHKDDVYRKRLAAMPTAIEMPYNSVVHNYIDAYVDRRRTLVEMMLGMSLYYMPIFEQALEKEGLPLELKYLPIVESALNPDAVSRAGATGLWQFMIGTAKGLGMEVNSLVDERRDPYRSSEIAAKYLKQLYGIYGDWSLAIAAYNCGPGNVNKALRRAGSGVGEGKDYWAIYNYLPRETRGYVPGFIAVNYVMTYYKEHNISPALAKKPILVDTVQVSKRVNLNQISSVLNVSMDELHVLNPQYRRDVIPGNSFKCTLALPAHQVYSYIMSEDSIVSYRPDLYAQREVVEPSGNDASSVDDGSDYTYETRTETKVHVVRRGENISQVAKKYGVTVSSIQSNNKIGRKGLQKGQRLKIVTSRKVKVNRPKKKDDSASELAMAKASSKSEVEEPDNEMADDEGLAYEGSRRIDVDAPAKKEKAEPKKEVKKEKAEPKKEKAESKKEVAKKEKAEPKKKDADTKYTLKKGESLFTVASKHGVTVEQLQDANGLKDADHVREGQEIVIPSGSSKAEGKKADAKKEVAKKEKAEPKKAKAQNHTIKKGENMSKIANKYGVTVNELMKANGMKNADQIREGQELKIPGKAPAKKSKSRRRR